MIAAIVAVVALFAMVLVPLLVVDIVSVGTPYARRAHAWLLLGVLGLAASLAVLVVAVSWL